MRTPTTSATPSKPESSTTSEEPGETPRFHRAIDRLDFPRSRWIAVLLLPIAFNALLWFGRDHLGSAWESFFVAWLDWLGLPGTVTMNDVVLAGPIRLRLPALQVSAGIPSAGAWLTAFGATIAVLGASIAIPETHAPLRYLLRLVVVVQATALLCFAVFPASFPYTVKSHLGDGLLLTVLLLFVVPWLHALTFHVFEFSLAQKASLTAITLAYFVVFAPVQYLLHAWLMHHLSLLVLPILYMLFGVVLDMLMLVAIYAWGMSWHCRAADQRRGQRPSP